MYELKLIILDVSVEKHSFILGVHRIVIFAEAEYSAECSLPKPNILPNIRHAE